MLTIKKLIFENDEPTKVLNLEDILERFQVTHPGILEQVSEVDTRIPSGTEHVEVNLIELDKPYSITLLLDQKEGEYIVNVTELQDKGSKSEEFPDVFHTGTGFSTFIIRYRSLEFLKDKIVDYIAKSFKKAVLREKLISNSQLDIGKEIELLYKPAFDSKGIDIVNFNKDSNKKIKMVGVKNQKTFVLDIEILKGLIFPKIVPVPRKSSKPIRLPIIYVINQFNGNMEDVLNHLAALVSSEIWKML